MCSAVVVFFKLVIYNVLSFFVGIPLAVFWGMLSAFAMCLLVWVIYPLIKLTYMAV